MTMPNMADALVDAASATVAERWQARIVEHLAERVDRELRAGGPPRPPTTEQAALALMRDMARDLQVAGDALVRAAEQLREAGKGYAASQAIQAGHAAQQSAGALLRA